MKTKSNSSSNLSSVNRSPSVLRKWFGSSNQSLNSNQESQSMKTGDSGFFDYGHQGDEKNATALYTIKNTIISFLSGKDSNQASKPTSIDEIRHNLKDVTLTDEKNKILVNIVEKILIFNCEVYGPADDYSYFRLAFYDESYQRSYHSAAFETNSKYDRCPHFYMQNRYYDKFLKSIDSKCRMIMNRYPYFERIEGFHDEPLKLKDGTTLFSNPKSDYDPLFDFSIFKTKKDAGKLCFPFFEADDFFSFNLAVQEFNTILRVLKRGDKEDCQKIINHSLFKRCLFFYFVLYDLFKVFNLEYIPDFLKDREYINTIDDIDGKPPQPFSIQDFQKLEIAFSPSRTTGTCRKCGRIKVGKRSVVTFY